MTQNPRRALIVSAAIGEGHNAAGRALEEAARRVWPGCEVHWLDTLAVAAPGFPRVARRFYVSQVQSVPWMYEFFFSAMWRHRWYLDATRRGAGAWFGRRMLPRICEVGPDVVLSTYPLGSAGLSWLRRRGELAMPAGAWIPAFCPHPSWLYPDLDLTYVMHECAAAIARRTEPDLDVTVGALPVRDAFTVAGQAESRARLGLRPDRFVVALGTGSLGFGRPGHAVAAALAAGPDVQVVAFCGRNRALRDHLARLGEPSGRLRVLGWTDDMPAWMTAADVVVSNAGGATGLEAVASGRPVVMFDPIAGHGRANAAVMAEAGLAILTSGPAELTAVIRRLARVPGLRARHAELAVARATDRCREDDLAQLATLRPR
jgi:UDP-N-acetylglucosamine:LPS N-acetylglucosamine transferase